MPPPDEIGCPDDDVEARERLPLSNVFMMGTAEDERLIGAVRAGQVNLPALLREAMQNNMDPPDGRALFQ